MFAFLFLLDLLFAYFLFFFFNDTATTEIYTLSLHDALPIYAIRVLRIDADLRVIEGADVVVVRLGPRRSAVGRDRKSTRLNSSHLVISYAVFCLKKKKKKQRTQVIQTGERSKCRPCRALSTD